MIPFLHLGPLTIPTFGLMVAAGLLVSAYVLQADFDRRRDTFLKSGYLKESNEPSHHDEGFLVIGIAGLSGLDRKSTRLNSSHVSISYAVFCLKKKIILLTSHIPEISRCIA